MKIKFEESKEFKGIDKIGTREVNLSLMGHIESFDVNVSEWDNELMTEVYYDNEYFKDDRSDEVFEIKLNYPLSGIASSVVKAKSWLELAYRICDMYKQIYDEEYQTSTVPEGKLENSYNRNTTNGRYGIWGHALGDLVLEGVQVYYDDNNLDSPKLVTAYIGS